MEKSAELISLFFAFDKNVDRVQWLRALTLMILKEIDSYNEYLNSTN